jgi:hypothetical protein
MIITFFFFCFSEIARVQSGRNGGSGVQYREPIKYVDVYRERPIRLTVRVLVPVREHPKVCIPFINTENQGYSINPGLC